jgi:type I restriction enzyme, S subunit
VSGMTHRERAGALPRFKPYPTYKESGVEWLAEIPAHWEVKRLKYLAPACISKLHFKPDGVVYVGLEHVESWTGRLLLENQPETVDSVVGSFRAGDVLFGKLRPYLAKVARPDFDGVCTSEILPLRPAVECSQSYVMYQLLNAPYIRWLDSLTYGTKMPRLSPDQIAGSFATLPLLSEQRAIAAFLDRETSRIDALVAKKERLIELLQEKRTAFITRAVPKGLDPTVPMRDSGVEWLGEVPAHWEMSRLSSVCKFEPGKAHEPYIDDEGEFVCVNSRFVSTKGKTIKFCNRNLSPARRNDVLMVMSDLPNGRALAKAFLVPEDDRYAVNQRVCILSAKNVDPKFLFYSVDRSPLFLRYDDGINQTHLPNAAFTKFPVLLPPHQEQTEIAQRLDDVTTRIDALSRKVLDAIVTLREFRTALISAAVTGKIDVREAAV